MCSLIVFEWLWSMTWDIGHLPFAVAITIILLIVKKKVPYKHAVGMILAVSLLQFTVYTGMVALITYGTAMNTWYTELSHTITINPLRSCITVGLIYSLLYEVVTWALYHSTGINAFQYGSIALVANIASALINYWIIRLAI